MRKYLSIANVIGAAILILGLVTYIAVRNPRSLSVVNSPGRQVQDVGPHEVKLRLYFAKPDGKAFLVEKRQVLLNEGESVYQRALDELVKGPKSSGEPIVPAGAKTPTVYVSGDTAYVDLPAEYLKLGYGTTGETILIYGIANTILDQGPLEEVWFTVAGKPAATLGHLSLEQPIRRRK